MFVLAALIQPFRLSAKQTAALCLVCAVLAPLDGEGQQSKPESSLKPFKLSIKEAVDKALKYAPQMQIAELDRLQSRARLSQAKGAAVLPDFEMKVLGGPITSIPDAALPENGFQNVEFENNFNDLGPFLRIETQAIQPIYTFNRLKNLKRAAQSGLEVSELEKRKVQNEITAQVKETYQTILYLYNLEDFIQEIKGRVAKVKAQVEDRLDSGSDEVTDIDLMRIKVFAAETNRRMYELEAKKQLAEDSLKVFLGFPDEQKLILTDDRFKRAQVDIKSFKHYWQRTLVARPELFQIKAGVQAQKYLSESKKAELFPQFFVLGFQRYAIANNRPDVENPYLTDNFNINSLGFTFGFRQNLSFHLTHAKFREERFKYEKARAEAKLAKLGIELEVRKAYTDLVAKQRSYESARSGFKASRSWVVASTLNFGAGLVPVQDLLQAFVSYSTIKAEYLATIYKFNVALTKLSRIVGENISG